nr:eukaryotic translation initiation factor 1-like [Symphalangus syndactylus]
MRLQEEDSHLRTRKQALTGHQISQHLDLSASKTAVSTEEKESYRKFAIQNLHSFNPFADASKGDDLLPAGTEDYIHIRIQQRNGRKTLTTVQWIADDYDKKKLVKAFKKFACNGTVIEHPEYGEVIQPQGDQRKNICQFLVELGLAKDDQLKVHGFYVLVAH